MKLATLRLEGDERACLLTGGGWLPIRALNRNAGTDWPEDLLSILTSGRLNELASWFGGPGRSAVAACRGQSVPEAEAVWAPLYRRPRKIWGIGLNYREHAADLSEKAPTAEPASFLKPDTTIIGHQDTIRIPPLSEKTTGEAELGLIFGTECRNVKREDWRSVLAGFTTVLDMTAEDILRRNPRNLTQAKSFDTFFSFGPVFHTVDEVPDVSRLKVQTVLNGRVHAENTVASMTFPPDYLVSYHSQIMTLLPGDIISSGTPGAAPLAHGDVVECRIDGFMPLVNWVVDSRSFASRVSKGSGRSEPKPGTRKSHE